MDVSNQMCVDLNESQIGDDLFLFLYFLRKTQFPYEQVMHKEVTPLTCVEMNHWKSVDQYWDSYLRCETCKHRGRWTCMKQHAATVRSIESVIVLGRINWCLVVLQYALLITGSVWFIHSSAKRSRFLCPVLWSLKTRTERIGSLDVATSCERKIDCVICVTLLNKFLQRFPSWKYIKYNAACTCISSGKYNFSAGLLQIK